MYSIVDSGWEKVQYDRLGFGKVTLHVVIHSF